MAEQNRISEMYKTEVVPSLMKEFGYKNVNEVPKLVKITLNMGLGNVKDNSKSFNTAVDELTLIAGQKAVPTFAKKAISNFKLRENMKIGARVTLRGKRMYEFFDRLVSIALPRVRDFRGISEKSFDGRGNYSMGIKEQLIFPEIVYARDLGRSRDGPSVNMSPSSLRQKRSETAFVDEKKARDKILNALVLYRHRPIPSQNNSILEKTG